MDRFLHHLIYMSMINCCAIYNFPTYVKVLCRCTIKCIPCVLLLIIDVLLKQNSREGKECHSNVIDWLLIVPHHA